MNLQVLTPVKKTSEPTEANFTFMMVSRLGTIMASVTLCAYTHKTLCVPIYACFRSLGLGFRVLVMHHGLVAFLKLHGAV